MIFSEAYPYVEMFVNDTSQIILLFRFQCKYGMQSVVALQRIRWIIHSSDT